MSGDDPISLDDFELVRVLGKGSFGKVILVRHTEGGRLYAMKVLRKEHLVKRNQVQHTMTERNVLGNVSYPFIVSLHYAFQTPTKLYLVLEYCQGGELFFHLSKEGRFSEGRCRFYAAELTLALEYLHRVSVIYRDLKPENVLLDAEGHMKLTDFGLSKEGIDDNISAKTMCGTPEYLAPEILERQGGGRASDWYSLGALVYEMLTGLPPYYSEDRTEMFERMRQGQPDFPPYVSKLACALLQGMLQREPANRLGAGARDGEEVRTHAFFAGVDWPAVERREVVPPFRPFVKTADDVSNFDQEFLNMPLVSSCGGTNVAGLARFEGFTFQGARAKGMSVDG